MYKYSKLNGLFKVDSKPTNSTQIDFISDLHLEFHIDYKNNLKGSVSKFIENFRKPMSYKDDKVLIVGGDISHDNKISKEFLTQLSNIWEYVLIIPGNHDWYFQDKRKDDRYADLIEDLANIENLIFLMDKVDVFKYNGIKIAGTIMFYNLDEVMDCVMWKNLLNDSKFLSRDFIQRRNHKDIDYYNQVINNVDIFVSHVPIVNLDGRQTTENLFLNVDVSPINDVLYISGHTHYPKNSVDIYSEFNAINGSYGYPHETSDGRKIVTSIFL